MQKVQAVSTRVQLQLPESSKSYKSEPSTVGLRFREANPLIQRVTQHFCKYSDFTRRELETPFFNLF